MSAYISRKTTILNCGFQFDLKKDDAFKKELAENNGYSILHIWESEFNKNIKDVTKKIKDSINTKG